MGEYRIEKDTLGEVKVPKNSYYGAQTRRAYENFQVNGLQFQSEFIAAQAVIKRSAALANQRAGILQKDIADAIVQVADEVLKGEFSDQFILDYIQAGAGTSQNMNMNEVLANRANEIIGGKLGQYEFVHPNDHVNMSQSTNDTIHTAIHISAVTESYTRLMPALEQLEADLTDKAGEFDDIIKCGRTHLQDAVPIRLGQEFGAYAEMIRLARQRIENALTAVKALPIGGTAVGTGLNTPPGYRAFIIEEISKLTGHEFVIANNMFEAMMGLDAIVEFSGALRVLVTSLKKIADDIRLLGSGPMTGLRELELPAVQPGSSIMPGKVNPVMAEMLNMACSQAIGCDTCIVHAAQGGQLELNVMMPVVAYNLLLMIQTLSGGMNCFSERCIRGLKANVDVCHDYAEKSTALATALNPLIGYHKAAEIAKRAFLEKKLIRDLANKRNVASKKELDKVLDLKRMTENPDEQ
jgi:fumarate hydratase class II